MLAEVEADPSVAGLNPKLTTMHAVGEASKNAEGSASPPPAAVAAASSMAAGQPIAGSKENGTTERDSGPVDFDVAEWSK